MWLETFLVGFWLTFTPPADLITDTTNVIIVEYSRSMGTGILTSGNYDIRDRNNNQIPIYGISILEELDSIAISDSSVIALEVPKLVFKMEYTIEINDVYDKEETPIDTTRNTGWYYYSGFHPNLKSKPSLIIK